MLSKLFRRTIGALLSSVIMISMIPAFVSADVHYQTSWVDFDFSGDPIMAGSSLIIDGVTLTVGGSANSQVSGTENRYIGVDGEDTGIGTYTFTLDENGPFAGCKISNVTIDVRSVVNCEFSNGTEGWAEFGANTIWEWNSNADEVTFAMQALAGNGHYFNYESISVCIEVPVSIDMHRVYNPNSGEHFYTSGENEYSTLIGLGWGDEGYGWTAPLGNGVPVYRLYNPTAGEHHYTTSDSERQALTELGWNDEGIGWLAADEGTPVYRLYNANQFANNHHFTSSEAERDELIALGWTYEGIAWYGYVEPTYS